MNNRSQIVRGTVADFARHARLFGAELVVETARGSLTEAEIATLEIELLLVGGKNGNRRQRHSTADLQAQVCALRDRGLMAAAIADALNISDRRVSTILTKSSTSQNGGHKPSVQARLFAA